MSARAYLKRTPNLFKKQSTFLLFLLIALLPAQAAEQRVSGEQEPQTKPAVDCGVFSMQGIKPGMTIDEVKATGVKLKARHASIPKELKGKVYQYRKEKLDGTLLLDEGGRVKKLVVSFATITPASLRVEVDYDSLVKILSERWGDAVSNVSSTRHDHNPRNAAIGTQITKAAKWENHECMRVAVLLYIGYTSPEGANIEDLRLFLARDMTLDELEAAADERNKGAR